jgi:hypothetical protein
MNRLQIKNTNKDALIVDGGIKVNDNIYCNGYINVNNLKLNYNDTCNTGIFFNRSTDSIYNEDHTYKIIIDEEGTNNLFTNSDVNKGSYIKYGNQSRIITNAKDNHITLDKDLDISVKTGDYIHIYDKVLAGIVYDQSNNKIIFGNYSSRCQDKENNKIDIYANNCYLDGEMKAMCFSSKSDIRLKENIKQVDINDMTTKILKLNTVHYNWNNIIDTNNHIGLIAQDVEHIIPEIVRTDNQGYKSIEYDKLSSILICSIKYLNNKVNILEDKIRQLELRIKN